MPRYRWLVFDADGTLFDYDRAELNALSRTFEHYDVFLDPASHRAFREINARLWGCFEEGTISSSRLRVKRFEDLTQALGLAFPASELSASYLANLGSERHLMPEAERVIRELSQGLRLVLATNGIAEVQRSRFFASTIGGFFTAVVISDEIGTAKPDRGFFWEVFHQIGNPDHAEVLMVGDGLTSDIEGAAGFGIDTCWFNPSGQPNRSGIEPTYEISELAEVLRIVGDTLM